MHPIDSQRSRINLLSELIDLASGPFSFVSHGVKMTYDWRRIITNKLILAREWEDDNPKPEIRK